MERAGRREREEEEKIVDRVVFFNHLVISSYTTMSSDRVGLSRGGGGKGGGSWEREGEGRRGRGEHDEESWEREGEEEERMVKRVGRGKERRRRE